MHFSKQEDIINRTASGSIAVFIFALILLFLVLYHLKTPNPLFAIGSGNITEISFAIVDAGNNKINDDQFDVAPSIAVSANVNENTFTDHKGEFNIKEHKFKNNNKLTEKTLAQKLSKKYKERPFKNAGGIGSYASAGEQGDPNGDPKTKGEDRQAGTITESHVGNFKFHLEGSAVVKSPILPKDTEEEGKVVVNITVNGNGIVTEAQANGRGTTTSSAILKAKAREAAFATKFNADGKNFERRGSITIIFAFE